jgi:N-acetylneuraminate synthase
MGAGVIEKHFTLDQSKIGVNNQMAMETDDFGLMVKYCHNVSKALGAKERVLTDAEIEQRKNMRRSVVTTRPLTSGHVISIADLTLKRPGTGIQPEDIDALIGRKLVEDLEADILIQPEAVQ